MTPDAIAAGGVSNPQADALRAEISSDQRRIHRAWLVVLLIVLLLVSIYSGGLFLYAVVVVGAVYLLAIVATILIQQDLLIWRHLSAEEVELGARVKARVVLQNRKSLPALWLFWQDRVDSGLDPEGERGGFRTLEPEAKDHLSYTLHTLRRGLFRIGPLVVEASDPLGLIRRYRVDDRASFLTVLPRAVPLGQGWPLGHKPIHQVPRRRSLFEDPTRFSGIRDYRPGDSLRRVHWRATARTGDLQVKVFEPSVLDGALLAVDMYRGHYRRKLKASDAGLGDSLDAGIDPTEELVITTAASIGKYVLDGGQAVGLLANGADAAERFPADWQGGSFRRLADALENAASGRRLVGARPMELESAKGPRQWHRLRLALARLTPGDGVGLGELLSMELPRLPRSLVLMVITPQLDRPLASALAALKRSGFELGVIWVRYRGQGDETERGAPLPVPLPQNVPLYRIHQASDLETLANQRL